MEQKTSQRTPPIQKRTNGVRRRGVTNVNIVVCIHARLIIRDQLKFPRFRFRALAPSSPRRSGRSVKGLKSRINRYRRLNCTSEKPENRVRPFLSRRETRVLGFIFRRSVRRISRTRRPFRDPDVTAARRPEKFFVRFF